MPQRNEFLVAVSTPSAAVALIIWPSFLLLLNFAAMIRYGSVRIIVSARDATGDLLRARATKANSDAMATLSDKQFDLGTATSHRHRNDVT